VNGKLGVVPWFGSLNLYSDRWKTLSVRSARENFVFRGDDISVDIVRFMFGGKESKSSWAVHNRFLDDFGPSDQVFDWMADQPAEGPTGRVAWGVDYSAPESTPRWHCVMLCAATDETSVDTMRRMFCCNFLRKR
jgi:hypothetical protein